MMTLIARSSHASPAAKLRPPISTRARGRLLDEFKRWGFQEGGSFTTKLDDFNDREPQAKLIRALWADLAAFGALRNSSEKALRRLIKKVTGKDALGWLTATDANQMIEALKAMKARAGHRQNSTGRAT